METNNLPDPNAIRLAEEKGLVFSEDKKILLKCTDDKITAITIPRWSNRNRPKCFCPLPPIN